jgi:hypothetical protein
LGLRIEEHLSLVHLGAATSFAHEAGRIEWGQGPYAHRAYRSREYCLGAVTSACAFLEATINEVLAHSARPSGGRISDVPEERRRQVAVWWERQLQESARLRTIEKYGLVLDVTGLQRIPRGLGPGQAVGILIALRNDLVHAEPMIQTAGAEQDEPDATVHDLTHRLRGRFPLNRLIHDTKPFHPGRSLGAGCAAWAVRAATGYVDAFFDELGGVPMHAFLRSDIDEALALAEKAG